MNIKFLMFDIMSIFIQKNWTGNAYGIQSLDKIYKNMNKNAKIISKNKLYTRLKRYKKIGLLKKGSDWTGSGYYLTDKGELWLSCKILGQRLCKQHKYTYKKNKKIIKKAIQAGEIYANSIDIFKIYKKEIINE